MTTTTTKTKTIRDVLNVANLNELAAALRRMGNFGDMQEPIKVTVTGLTAAAAIDITSAAVKAAATIVGGKTLASGENLPAIAKVCTLRVTAVGTGATGPRHVTDASGTAAAPPTATAYAGASVGVATISDDGKTLTFEGTVTGFVLTYLPRPATDIDSEYAPST